MAWMGIDYGARRIGLAHSDSGILASPHSTIAHASTVEATVEAIERVAGPLEVDRFVVGIPRSNRPHPHSLKKFERFADALRQKTCKEVVLWDESLSTVEALERRRERGRSGRNNPRPIDQEAATIILQSYLDHQSGRTS